MMILPFGFVGFFLVQVALTGVFGLSVPLPFCAATLAMGLVYIGLAFSQWSHRYQWPLAAAILLAVLGSMNLVFHGSAWWSAEAYLFSVVSLAVSIRMNRPLLWEDMLHPTRLVATVRHSRHQTVKSSGAGSPR